MRKCDIVEKYWVYILKMLRYWLFENFLYLDWIRRDKMFYGRMDLYVLEMYYIVDKFFCCWGKYLFDLVY